MLGRLSLLLALLAAGAAAHAAQPDPIPFDAKRQHVYWCGQPVSSPLVVTLDAGKMRVNGIAPRALAADTTAQEEEALQIYGKVPEMQRAHVHGYPWRDAEQYLSWTFARMGARVRNFYTRGAPQGAAQARQAGMQAIDTSMVDASKPVVIDSTKFRFTPRGLGREVEYSGKPPKISGLRPASADSGATEALVVARAESFRQMLKAPGPLVLLADAKGDKAISGQQAVQAQSAIEALIATAKTGAPAAYGPEHVVLGKRAFEQLVSAAQHP